MASTKQNPGVSSSTAPSIDTRDWQKEQIGFDPYWTPAEGKTVIASVLGRDERDPKFVRYQLMAASEIECQRGPGDEMDARHEKAIVKAGETFNISMYYSLEKPLNEYINFAEDTGKAVVIKLTCTGDTKTKAGNDCWLWDVQVSPATKAALVEWRKEHTPRQLKAGNAGRAALEA